MKLGIGICNSNDKIPSEFFWSFVALRQVCPTMIFRGTHPWDVVRNNQIITNFLKSDCDVFVKMDIDQAYPSNYFEVMLPLMKDHAVIGPMIYDRCQSSGFMPLCKTIDAGVPFWPPESTHDGKTGIEEVPYLHTNCFYNRGVLEALKPPYYEAHLREDGLERKNHVDYTFMKKISAAGHKIYINNDVVVGHLAVVPVTRQFHERHNRKDTGILQSTIG